MKLKKIFINYFKYLSDKYWEEEKKLLNYLIPINNDINYNDIKIIDYLFNYDYIYCEKCNFLNLFSNL